MLCLHEWNGMEQHAEDEYEQRRLSLSPGPLPVPIPTPSPDPTTTSHCAFTPAPLPPHLSTIPSPPSSNAAALCMYWEHLLRPALLEGNLHAVQLALDGRALRLALETVAGALERKRRERADERPAAAAAAATTEEEGGGAAAAALTFALKVAAPALALVGADLAKQKGKPNSLAKQALRLAEAQQTQVAGQGSRGGEKAGGGAGAGKSLKLDGIYRVALPPSLSPATSSATRSTTPALPRTGVKWLKLVSTKHSSLLAEFRAAESELAVDEDFSSGEDYDGEEGYGLGSGAHTAGLEAHTASQSIAQVAAKGKAPEEDEDDVAFVHCSLYRLLADLADAAETASRLSEAIYELGGGLQHPPQQPVVELILTRLAPPEPAPDREIPPRELYAMPEETRYAHRLRRLERFAQSKGIQLSYGADKLAQLVALQQSQSPAPAGADPTQKWMLPSQLASDATCHTLPPFSSMQLPTIPLPTPKPADRPVPFRPTRLVNLDLSALVALVSDISHMRLDASLLGPPAEADLPEKAGHQQEGEHVERRYLETFKALPPWKQEQLRCADLAAAAAAATTAEQASADPEDKDGTTNSSAAPSRSASPAPAPATAPTGRPGRQARKPKNTALGKAQSGGTQGRALALQLQREARAVAAAADRNARGVARWGWAFLPAIARTVLGDDLSKGREQVRFCTTSHAKVKAMEILRMVAGETEQRRLEALFGETDEQRERFWRGSRYEGEHELRASFALPVQVIDSPPAKQATKMADTAFARFAAHVLASALSSGMPAGTDNSPAAVLARPLPEQLHGSANKQTAHTLHSMLVGLVSGVTTLSTNIASTRWLLREMNRVSGGIGADFLVQPTDELSHALLWVTYPRSLAENMRFRPAAAAAPAPDSQQRMARPALQSVTGIEERYTDATPSSAGSFKGKGELGHLLVHDHQRLEELNLDPASPPTTRFRRAVDFFYGPRRPARMTIRHYKWWPFAPVENAWQRVTRPVRWKDPALHLTAAQVGACVYTPTTLEHTVDEERDADGDAPRAWLPAVKRELKLNAGHWILLFLTLLGWIVGFGVISDHLWYRSAVQAVDSNSTASPDFFGCTTTYWTQNANCGLDGSQCSPFASNDTQSFRCPAGCASTTLGAARAIGNLSINYVPMLVGGGDPDVTYRGDSWICAAAVHAGVFKDSTGGCGVIKVTGTFSDYEGVSRNGLRSYPFASTFPLSYRFSVLESSGGCADERWKGYTLDVVLSAFVAMVLQPKPIVLFWILVCLGFWHVNMISEPR